MDSSTQNPMTVQEAVEDFLYVKRLARSAGTAKAYRHGLDHFLAALAGDPDVLEARTLDLQPVLGFIERIQQRDLAATTQRLYAAAVKEFYKYLVAHHQLEVNVAALETLIRGQVRRPGYRLPQFPREDIERMLVYAASSPVSLADKPRDHLRNLRDRAFLLTLADTGLRVHEAVALRRGEVDWNEGRAVIVGKGDKQAVIRFSLRVMSALKAYLQTRQPYDGASGRQLSALPLFARHDKRAGDAVKPISTETGRNIVKQRVEEVLGPEAVGTITPHSFRHYFVTTVLQATGGNIHVAQKLARHSSITVTERYAHLSDNELDMHYHEVFNQNQG